MKMLCLSMKTNISICISYQTYWNIKQPSYLTRHMRTLETFLHPPGPSGIRASHWSRVRCLPSSRGNSFSWWWSLSLCLRLKFLPCIGWEKRQGLDRLAALCSRMSFLLTLAFSWYDACVYISISQIFKLTGHLDSTKSCSRGKFCMVSKIMKHIGI